MGLKTKKVVIDYRNIPTIKKAKKRLGPLWFLLYDTCSCDPCKCMEKVRKLFYGHVWNSPSDRIEKNVIMKAPFTRKNIQATAHKILLDIGTKVEQDILQEFDIEKQDALILQEQILTKQFQESTIEQIKDAEAVERAACHQQLQRLQEQLELKLVNDIVDMEYKMENEFQDSSTQHKEKLEKTWERKLEKAVEKTTKKVTKTLLNELTRQEEILEKHFQSELKKKELLKKYEIERQSAEFEKTLQIEKQRIECQNIGNMMYLLCMERRKCFKTKKLIEKHYAKVQSDLIHKVSTQKKKMESLQKELEGQIQQINLREVCYLEIIKQYQKFINFALRSAPTQAQFLLSMQKLLTFELSEILPKESAPVRLPRLCDTLLPWAQTEPNTSRRVVSGLEMTDYHNCFNELALPKIEGQTELPAFYFKNKLYVREDFRNLISQGITISPSHDMWSEDLEILLKTLKEFASEPDLYKDLTDMEGIKEKKDTYELMKEVCIQKTDPKSKKLQVQKSTLKGKLFPGQKQTTHAISVLVENSPSLLATSCSVELLKQKGKIKLKSEMSVIEEANSKEQDEQEIRVDSPVQEMKKLKESDTEIRTSIIYQSDTKLEIPTKLQKTSVTLSGKGLETHRNTVEENLTYKTSKIATAKDSIQILRESRQALESPTTSNISSKKEDGRKNHYQTMAFRDICCEKCLRQRGLELEEIKYNKNGSDESRKRKTSDISEKVIGTVQPDHMEVDMYKDECYLDKLDKLYHLPKPKDKNTTSELEKKRLSTPSAKNRKDIETKEAAYDNDYTIQRMRSFISVISENPKLIKLFTACQQ